MTMSENEEIERTPANANPWYWLATVYGEQEEEDARSAAPGIVASELI